MKLNDDQKPNNAALLHEYGLKVDMDYHIINGQPVLSLLGMKALMANENYLNSLRNQALEAGYPEDAFINATNAFIAKREALLKEKYKDLIKKDDADLDI